MIAFMIPIALLAGWLLGYPNEVIAAGTASACIARFVLDVARDCLEALL
jgi:hypothetical protein